MILLTGFGPFPGIAHNASADLVAALSVAAAKRFPKKNIVAHVLPTEWAAAPHHLAKLYRAHDPVLSLHFGVSARAQGFCIETTAHNTQRMAPDAANRLPTSNTVAARGPDTLPVTINARRIVRRLNGLGVPASVSPSAGTYLCNSVLYRSIEWSQKQVEPGMAGFIHMPVTFSGLGSGPGFGFDTALAGGMEIIRACLGLPPLQTPPVS